MGKQVENSFQAVNELVHTAWLEIRSDKSLIIFKIDLNSLHLNFDALAPFIERNVIVKWAFMIATKFWAKYIIFY